MVMDEIRDFSFWKSGLISIVVSLEFDHGWNWEFGY